MEKRKLELHSIAGPLPVWRFGEGPPVLLLHRDIGRGPWTRFHDALAEEFEVVVPSLPGFDGSPRPPWMRTVTDLTRLLHRYTDQLHLDAPVVVGLGFGGWVAAESAAMRPAMQSGLVLHAPMGLRPATGEYLDQFLVSETAYLKAGFSDPSAFERTFGKHLAEEQQRQWDGNREATTQVAWRPYMYDLALGPLLSGLPVPTAVWMSEDDRIVPPSCGEQYAELLTNATLDTIAGVGHHAELESPEAFATYIMKSIAAVRRDGA